MNAREIETMLHFWFEELTPEDWFSGGDALDARIRDRFGELHARTAARASADLDAVLADCRGGADVALATVIVLDQLSRNIHRGTADAFANDDAALAITRQSIERGLDEGLPDPRRSFLYMPLMHAEDLDAQDQSVALFAELSEEQHAYAVKHRDIVARYGRFPYRNDALGRTTTPAEAQFLEDGPRFGQ
jgi:uncharacterized protein (DUF924 family)